MRKNSVWIGQFVLACTTMFAVLAAVGLLRGEVFAEHWIENLAWAATASAIFVGSRYWQARKGAQCAVCDVVNKK
jgi:ABC-type spermidine/putrescine transport system permease subunit II